MPLALSRPCVTHESRLDNPRILLGNRTYERSRPKLAQLASKLVALLLELMSVTQYFDCEMGCAWKARPGRHYRLFQVARTFAVDRYLDLEQNVQTAFRRQLGNF